MAFKFTMKTNLLICFIGFVLAIIFNEYILEIYLNLWLNLPVIFGSDLLVGIPVIIELMLIISFVHEMFHGLTYKILGREVKYGFKWKMLSFYCQEVTGISIERYKFFIILIAPFIGISFISFYPYG